MIRVEDLRQTVDLLTLVVNDTHLRKVGVNWYAGPCPFCGGHDRFVLKHTQDGWRWLCRHCTDGKYHDVIDYVRRRDGIDFKEALMRLGGDLSHLRGDDQPPFVQPQPKPPEPQPQDSQTLERLTGIALEAANRLHDPRSSLGAEVRAYLTRRGLLAVTAERALLGAALVFDPQAGRKRPAVVIPYLDGKRKAHAIKYRFVDDDPGGLRYVMEWGSRTGLYHLDDAIGCDDRLLILEGEINLLSVAQVLPELDLISTGSQSVTETMKQMLMALTKRYHQVWVWMDKPQRAVEIARLVRGIPLQSPQREGEKWDANRLLQADLLNDFIERVTGAPCYGLKLCAIGDYGWRTKTGKTSKE